MKMLATGLCACLVAAIVQAAEYRTFTDTQGRAIEAKLIDADASQGQVYLQREDGKKVWVSPVAFSGADQDYIRSWAALHAALSDRSFKVSADLVSIPHDGSERRYADNGMYGQAGERWSKVHHKVHYAIEFENMGIADIPEMSIECHSYIKMVARGSRSDRLMMVAETLTVAPIRAGERSTLSTREVNLKEWSVTQIENVWSSSGTTIIDTIRSQVETHEERMEGLWIRISVPLGGDERLVRDFCFPDDLKDDVAWDESTGNPFPAGGTPPAGAGDNPAESINTLDFVTERGRPSDRSEFRAWMNTAGREITAAGTDKDLLKRISDGMEIFYTAKFDSQGRRAWAMAVAFEKAEAYDLALRWYEISVQTDEFYLVHFVEMLASSSVEGLRNGELAVKYALIALEQDKKSDERLEMLARAYARNGQFDWAIKTQEKAIQRLQKSRKDEDDLAIYRERLALYQAGRPFTERPK